MLVRRWCSANACFADVVRGYHEIIGWCAPVTKSSGSVVAVSQVSCVLWRFRCSLSAGRELLSHGQFDVAYELLRPADAQTFTLSDVDLAKIATAAAAEYFNAAHSLYPTTAEQDPSMSSSSSAGSSSSFEADALTMSVRCLSMCPKSPECVQLSTQEQQVCICFFF